MRGCTMVMANDASLTGYRRRARLLMTTSIAGLMLANVAMAQEAPSIQLNTIVIDGDTSPIGPDKGYIAKNTTMGTKTDTPLREIPQSISVITREQMDDRFSERVEDTIAYTSGVTASPWGVDERFDQFLIRGLMLALTRSSAMGCRKRPSIFQVSKSSHTPFNGLKSSRARHRCFTAQTKWAVSSIW